jgi:imidazolonepropionase-like amidohydrolase
MKKQLFSIILLVFAGSAILKAQETFPVNGIPDQRKQYHAFTNVKLWTDYQTQTDSATLIIYDGKVMASGKGIKIPDGAVIHNMKGKNIYPSFIDLDSQYGVNPAAPGEKPKGQQHNSSTKGAYSWNQALKPEVHANEIFDANDQNAAPLRKAGFGTVLTFSHDGVARGTGAVVLLSDDKDQEEIIKDKAAACYSFNKGTSQQDYPSSEMGSIALLRQAYLDADWYKKGGFKEEYNISLQAWNDNQGIPQLFEAEDKFQSIRIDKVGDEFGVKFIIKGSGDEYERLAEIKATGNAFILPLKFPEGYDLSDPYEIINISLEELKHWEMAPANAFLLNQAGVPFAFTSSGLKDASEFCELLRKVVSYGLPVQEALKACTYTPATLMGVSDKVGALKKDMIANFIITSGDLFSKENIILENWIQGKQYIINKSNTSDIRGTYTLSVQNRQNYNLQISGELYDLKAKVGVGADTVNGSVNLNNHQVTIKFESKKDPDKGSFVLSGFRKDTLSFCICREWTGSCFKSCSWTASRISPLFPPLPADTTTKEIPQWGNVLYPNKAYGFSKLPEKEKVLFHNVTVWTNEKEGILTNQDVLIADGKIAKIGTNLDSAGAIVVDGTGKHLTSGIIDEHSHIAISSNVNECSHAITSEVRIGDVIDCDDINIYRQLAGGVTTAQLLHGSCNPIGGQSAIIKLRWGLSPEKLKFEGADGFIKFALGENVKQSNWGDDYKTRYPQTRMGVEQVYLDGFMRAKEYEASWKKYSSDNKNVKQPRRDLRLETLVEIMNKKRFITCHSYQQGEINMLMHVADSMGFKINTFTHILEGYKVADKMKAHGVGASTFSDWWAYKFEVIEAIPYNGAIMHDEGLIVAFNSDDGEMARRLNQEAAKAVKYGNISEEEAFKFVSLNPAKLLHIDNRVGSIKVGKDADVVLWNDNPLSAYARVQMTFIDGVRYYDINRDAQSRIEIQNERARILSKMSKEGGKDKSAGAKKPMFREEVLKHCLD